MTSITNKLLNESRSMAADSFAITWTLFRIIIPVLIIIKALELLGVVRWLADISSPLMVLIGLPGESALAWLMTVATGIYGGMAVFFTSSYSETLTVAQVSVLGGLMLISHGLPVEGAIAKRAGVTWTVTLMLRLFGGFVFALLLHWTYQAGHWLQTPNRVPIPTLPQANTLTDWAIGQLYSLLLIFLIIVVLVVLLRILRYLHVERLMAYLLSPVLKLLGIGNKATNITIIGMTLGLSYGGGLLIKEAESGNVSKQDVFAAICLLHLSHSLIEDTILVLMLGADLSAVLWGRLFFTFIVISILTRWAKGRSPDFIQRFLVR